MIFAKQADYFILTAFQDIIWIQCRKIRINRIVSWCQTDTKSLIRKVFFHV